MEKKRRARINESIEKLKALIVPLISKDVSRCLKLYTFVFTSEDCSIENFKSELYLTFDLYFFQTSRYSKLEKADILEMTVSYFKDLPSSPVKGKTFIY